MKLQSAWSKIPRIVETLKLNSLAKNLMKDASKTIIVPESVAPKIILETPKIQIPASTVHYDPRVVPLSRPISKDEIKGISKGERNQPAPKNPIKISLINRSNTYLPIEGEDFVLQSPEISKNLPSVHFTINEPVTGNNGGNWDSASTTLLLPYGNIRKVAEPINIELMDTFFPNYNGLKFSTKGSKVFTGDKSIYDYYDQHGVDAQYSKEVDDLTKQYNNLYDRWHRKQEEIGWINTDPELLQMERDLDALGTEIQSRHYNFVDQYAQRPSFEDILKLQQIEGLRSGVEPLRYNDIATDLERRLGYTWFSAPPTHWGLTLMTPSDRYYKELPKQQKMFVDWLTTHKSDYRKQGGKINNNMKLKFKNGGIVKFQKAGKFAELVGGIFNNMANEKTAKEAVKGIKKASGAVTKRPRIKVKQDPRKGATKQTPLSSLNADKKAAQQAKMLEEQRQYNAKQNQINLANYYRRLWEEQGINTPAWMQKSAMKVASLYPESVSPPIMGEYYPTYRSGYNNGQPIMYQGVPYNDLMSLTDQYRFGPHTEMLQVVKPLQAASNYFDAVGQNVRGEATQTNMDMLDDGLGRLSDWWYKGEVPSRTSEKMAPLPKVKSITSQATTNEISDIIRGSSRPASTVTPDVERFYRKSYIVDNGRIYDRTFSTFEQPTNDFEEVFRRMYGYEGNLLDPLKDKRGGKI